MRKGAGKAKGSSFERATARELSLWLTDGADKAQLIRSVLSGGWQNNKNDWRQVGDLAPNGPVGEKFRKKYAVECKHHRSIDWWKLYTGKSEILMWWDKLNAECIPHNLQPMLIMKMNNRPALIGMRVGHNDTLLGTADVEPIIYLPRHDVGFVSFDYFKSNVLPKHLGL